MNEKLPNLPDRIHGQHQQRDTANQKQFDMAFPPNTEILERLKRFIFQQVKTP